MKNYIQYSIILALAIALIFSAQRCSYNKTAGDKNADALTSKTEYYKNTLGTKTATIKTLQVDKASLKELLLKKDKELMALSKEFAKINSIVKYESVTKIDSIRVPYSITIPCVFERSGEVTDKWYSFGYSSNQNGFKIDSLEIPNTATVITGVKRKWILGKETITTDITNSNPYVKTSNIKSAEIVVPSPWYKKWYVWLAVGIAGGFALK